ncbi:3-phosphoglycerate dehydrogenase [candidate division KSB3 bacterium]|uniref:3-phosphoglycerate dehydrogenase n=1 Tax=candidate division KSB3 bacterium TaxID=2044937 RepID=A0A9D5Q4I1_9BACT|nr:3-phosphoglycerate dehydrogenase [candidate division KSB3 bacterium]MBD3323744.1 3-phosphoglycerate dehydrogenase [candidate division KSB3 bacterium]
MAYTVFVPQPIAEEGTQFLRAHGYEVKMGSGWTEEIMKAEVQDCDAMLVRTALVTADVLKAGKQLKVVSRHGTGVDNIDIPTATELGIYVTNGPESNANSVAEQAIGMMIACARNYSLCDRSTRAGNFEIRDQIRGVDLEKKTVGIIGLGRVGKIVARKAKHGLDMNVVGYDPFVQHDQLSTEITLVDDVQDLLREADFVTLHLPSNPETKGIIGEHAFELMKPTAYIINTARGDLIDEAALVQALREHNIAGAGLDVYAQEPPPKDHPLFSLDNVMLTPHNSTLTKECVVRLAVHAAIGIDEVLSGKPPTWPVNTPKGR